jgi:DNA anti-recombination protein RmuC
MIMAKKKKKEPLIYPRAPDYSCETWKLSDGSEHGGWFAVYIVSAEQTRAEANLKLFKRRNKMKTKVISTLWLALSLGAFSATASAQHEGHATTKAPAKSAPQGKPAHDHMMMEMAKEPHHVLAMAYHQNLATFAKSLHEQTMQASSVNVEFARAATTEMRRSFDQMNQHHQEHMQTMSAEMHTRMSGMMKQMETHHTELNTQLRALEQEVNAATPDAKKVSTLAASVHTHLDAMSKMHEGGKGGKMKMKM